MKNSKKNKSNLEFILKITICVIALVAFFLMFTPQAKYGTGNNINNVSFNVVFFGGAVTDSYTGAGSNAGFIGYLLILAGVIINGLTLLVLKNKLGDMFISLIAGGLMIAGGVLVMSNHLLWLLAQGNTVAGLLFQGSIESSISITTGSLITGILACIAGVLAILAPYKHLIK